MEVSKSFLIIIVVVLSFGVTVIAGRNGLLSARCAARCLTEHKDSLKGGKDRNNHRKYKMLDRCRSSAKCYECMKPCAVSVDDLNNQNCHSYCQENEPLCEKSCQFLYYTHTYKAGDCPAPESATGFDAVCLASCRIDGDCTENQKCCPNTCGYVCRVPDYTGYNVPLVPSNISYEERRQGRALWLSWILPAGNQSDSGLVVYVLEHRNTTNQKPVWKQSSWTTVAVTLSRETLIREIHAGHWYQYRVAAVTDDGTQGFSTITQPFISSKSVQKPSPPQNISEGVTTVRKGHVDITLHWKPPKYSDMPIWRYIISYSERLQAISPVLIRITELDKTVPGHTHESKITMLKPGTTYKIRIVAKAMYGNREYRSKAAFYSVTTYTPPNMKHKATIPSSMLASLLQGTQAEQGTNSTIPLYEDIIHVENLEVVDNLPYFDKGSLKALISWEIGKDIQNIVKSYMIYWSPHSCDQDYSLPQPYQATSDLTRFEIYDLQYECQYLIEVRAVTKAGGQGRQSKVKLRTPQCRRITVKSESLKPDCPIKEAEVPKSPRHVRPHIVQSNCSIELHLSWRHPRSDQPVVSYKITYEMTDRFRDDSKMTDTGVTVYKPQPTTVHLDKVTSYTLYNLEGSEVYVIRIYAISRIGRGEPAYIEILTPRIFPCGLDKDPVPPDRDKEKTTLTTSTTVFPPPEGSTSNIEGSTTTVSIATQSINRISTKSPNKSREHAPKLNIYKTVYYLFLFLYKLFTHS